MNVARSRRGGATHGAIKPGKEKEKRMRNNNEVTFSSYNLPQGEYLVYLRKAASVSESHMADIYYAMASEIAV